MVMKAIKQMEINICIMPFRYDPTKKVVAWFHGTWWRLGCAHPDRFWKAEVMDESPCVLSGCFRVKQIGVGTQGLLLPLLSPPLPVTGFSAAPQQWFVFLLPSSPHSLRQLGHLDSLRPLSSSENAKVSYRESSDSAEGNVVIT